MLNLDLGRARAEELHRRARSARLARHAHRSAGGARGRRELRVGLAYLLVRWGLALLRPRASDELDGREAERLLHEGGATSAFTA
jgi:hypothetical protein